MELVAPAPLNIVNFRYRGNGTADDETLNSVNREILMRLDPESFYITDHYRAHPYVLARLATVDRGALRDLLEEAWRRAGPRRQRHD